MRVGDWTQQAEQSLAEKDIDAPRLEAQVMLATALDRDRSWVMAHPDESFDPSIADAYLVRRLRREPLAYITGKREFYGRSFRVGPGVLVPRQETEVLVNEALKQIDRCSAATPRVLDLGTGSGILAITLKLEREQASVQGIDISDEALAFAGDNAAILGSHVLFSLSNLFDQMVEEQFHIVVCNPPYIAHEAELMPEVRHHEPHLALFADESGYAVYHRLANEAQRALMPEGVLILELGDDMAGEVIKLFERKKWRVLGVRNDLGGMPRSLTVAPIGNLI